MINSLAFNQVYLTILLFIFVFQKWQLTVSVWLLMELSLRSACVRSRFPSDSRTDPVQPTFVMFRELLWEYGKQSIRSRACDNVGQEIRDNDKKIWKPQQISCKTGISVQREWINDLRFVDDRDSTEGSSDKIQGVNLNSSRNGAGLDKDHCGED